jgi:hypothetical protein
VLLTMALIIAGVSTYSEVKLVHASAWLRNLYVHGKGGIDGVYFNTAGSFILSWLMGVLFGASGVTVFLGGILSTGMSQAYFSAEGFVQDRGWSLEKAKTRSSQLQSSYRSKKAAATKVADDFRQPVKDLMSLILVIIKIIVAPVVAIRKMSVAYTERRNN